MGMAASQGRLLFMTARLSNNEFEQQCVAYSKQRLADSSQKANDQYLDALNATSYQILTGYNGNEATYADVTYNQLTGFFGNSTIPLTDGTNSNQLTGVAANKQYIVTDNKGQILVTQKIADAFNNSKGDYNKFLEEIGGLTQVKPDDITQQNVHEAWDKYLVSVGMGANSENSLHIAGFSFGTGENADSEKVDFVNYQTMWLKSQALDAEGEITNEKLFLNVETVGDNPINNKYYVKNYEVIAIPDADNEGGYLPAYKTDSMQGTELFIPLDTIEGMQFKDGKVLNADGEPMYLNPANNTYSTEYRTEVSSTDPNVESGPEQTLFYQGTTAEQRNLYDYAMAISKEWATDPTQRLTYDASKISYYQNIYNQMITKGFTTYQEMLDTKYMSATEGNEKIAFQDENWFITQLKAGRLNILYYSAVEKEFIGTSLDDDESICEREDKSKIAIAEQEYQTKMDRLEAQDKQFDLTLNRLEAEHNALQTEYDAVSKIISKNVEKSFNVFNA